MLKSRKQSLRILIVPLGLLVLTGLGLTAIACLNMALTKTADDERINPTYEELIRE